MSLVNLKKILNKYNIDFDDKESKYFSTALTHSSYLNEKKNLKESYDRLEFLGDSILSFCVSKYIFNDQSKVGEGDLTNIRAKLVRTKTLSELSIKLKLNECIFLASGEKKDNGAFKEKTCADVFEAIIGAIFLTKGIEKADQFIQDTLFKTFYDSQTALENLKSYKTILQEKMCSQEIKYVVEDQETLPNNSHKFYVSVQIMNVKYGFGVGPNKKEAEAQAAKDALERLNINE